MKAAGRPISAALRGRRYIAQAAAQAKAAAREDVQVTRMPNGAVVASIENCSPVSRLAVFYNAGSRFETGSNVGVVHCIRNAADLSTKTTSGFVITRELQQMGASLSCTSTREHLIYSVDCLRSNVEQGVQILGDVASSPAFNHWELGDNIPRLQLDLAMLDCQPHVQLMEALHKAAYRSTTLGNSLYMPEYSVGSHSADMLQSFAEQHFVSGNAAVIGVGVDHDTLVKLTKKMQFTSGSAPAKQAPTYGGGEVRVDTLGDLVCAAVATEGPSLGSKDLLASAVLQKVLGPGPSIKYSSNVASSKASKAAGQGTSQPYAAACFSASYSDSGLFGFQVIAQASDAGNVLKSVVDAFGKATKDGEISEADVKRAKAQLKAACHMQVEESGSLMEDLGVQTLLTGQVLSPADIATEVDKLTTADIQAVAKKVINGKPSMAAVGNLYNTPYLDQLL